MNSATIFASKTLVCLLFVINGGRALICWRCDVAGGEEECLDQGSPELCHPDQACFSELREENGRSMLIQSCKQKFSCEELLHENERFCKINRPELSLSLCHDCCWHDNFCNNHNMVPREPTKASKRPKSSDPPVTSTPYVIENSKIKQWHTNLQRSENSNFNSSWNLKASSSRPKVLRHPFTELTPPVTSSPHGALESTTSFQTQKKQKRHEPSTEADSLLFTTSIKPQEQVPALNDQTHKSVKSEDPSLGTSPNQRPSTQFNQQRPLAVRGGLLIIVPDYFQPGFDEN